MGGKGSMRVDEFDYHLPEELIAQEPATPRDSSRLMVVDRSRDDVSHRRFSDLPGLLAPGDVLVLNDTRVMPARLMGARADTGGRIEVLLLKQVGLNQWETLVKPGRRAKVGTQIVFGDGELKGEVLDKTDVGGRVVQFEFAGPSFEAILDRLGQMPLPPYIKAQLTDSERYQTVYARETGSAAAPTAGLHFTPQLLAELEGRGVSLEYITLHVGLGTFRPVSADTIEEHIMHSEFFRITQQTADAIAQAKSEGRRVIAVGTTTVRTLEAAAGMGAWQGREGWTDIFIYPGYRFQVIDGMITNFHLPKSTLLMLVSAFVGRERTMEAYGKAVEERYRFFSFGDAMLLI